MEEWTYEELKEAIYEDIQEFKNDNYLNSQIAGRCFYEYTTVILEGYTESVLIHTIIGDYIIKECSEDTLKFHSDQISANLRNYSREKLDGSLNELEIKELEININEILNKIQSLI